VIKGTSFDFCLKKRRNHKKTKEGEKRGSISKQHKAFLTERDASSKARSPVLPSNPKHI